MTKQTQFRLDQSLIDLISRLRDQLRAQTRLPVNRTDVVRLAIQEMAERKGVVATNKNPKISWRKSLKGIDNV